MANTLGDMIRERAADRGDAPAITYQDRTITYAELDARSNQVAHALRAAGIGRGDRVAIFDKNVPEFFELLLGAVKLGAVLAAVNWRLAPPEVAQILNDATARVLLAGAEFLPCVEAIEPELETVELVITTESGTIARPGFARVARRAADRRSRRRGVARRDRGAVLHVGNHRAPEGRHGRARHDVRPARPRPPPRCG